MTEPFSNFGSSYGLSMTSAWPGSAAQSSTLLSGNSTWLWNIGSSPTDTAYPNSTIYDLMSDTINQSFLGSGEEPTLPDLSNTRSSPHSSGSFATPANQPLYYAVTGGSLKSPCKYLHTVFAKRLISNILSRNSITPNPPSPKHRLSSVQDYRSCLTRHGFYWH